jgi:hypothetical protein
MARDLGRALAVRPIDGREAWFSGIGDARTVTLTAPAQGSELMFGLWYDTEAGYDVLTLEASTDAGETWAKVPFELRSGPSTDGTISGFGGRRWHLAEAELPEGDVLVRWRYASDANTQGRGVYVDRVRLDGERIPDDSFITDGWTRSPN